MSVWRMVGREILYRKLSFALAVLSVVAAVGCLVSEFTLLHLHDLATDQIIAAKERETAARMTRLEADTNTRMVKLEDDYRKITRNLGFNVLILPKDQDLGELHVNGYATKYMPESYARKLAESRIVSINHLLPILQQKLKWQEQERTVLVIGTRGEVPLLLQNEKKPILDHVPAGKMVVGYELRRNLKLAAGDKIKLQGQEFTVHKLHPERGTVDDITLWINLAEAQKMLRREGEINAILALECNCAADRLDTVRSEIAAVLPDTQVLELATQALARAEARNRAAAEARAARDRAASEARVALSAEMQTRTSLRQQLDAFAATLIPLVLLGCMVWLGVLTLSNVRDRAPEIGILRALGVRSGQVFALFLARAVLVGLLGALIGYGAGISVANLLGEESAWPTVDVLLSNQELLLQVVVAAPVLCALVGWLPALLAARQDPAVILREA